MIYLISWICAIVGQWVLERFWWSSIGASISSTFLTLIKAIGAHYNIYGEQVFIDLVKTLIISFIISVLVGAVFVSVRKKSEQQKL